MPTMDKTNPLPLLRAVEAGVMTATDQDVRDALRILAARASSPDAPDVDSLGALADGRSGEHGSLDVAVLASLAMDCPHRAATYLVPFAMKTKPGAGSWHSTVSLFARDETRPENSAPDTRAAFAEMRRALDRIEGIATEPAPSSLIASAQKRVARILIDDSRGIRLLPRAGGRHVAILDMDEAMLLKATDGRRLQRVVDALLDDAGEDVQPGNTAACMAALARLRGAYASQLARVEAALAMQRRDDRCDVTAAQLEAIDRCARDLMLEAAELLPKHSFVVDTGAGFVVAAVRAHDWLVNLLRLVERGDDRIEATRALVTEIAIEHHGDAGEASVMREGIRAMAWALANPGAKGDYTHREFEEAADRADVAKLVQIASTGEPDDAAARAMQYLCQFLRDRAACPSPADLDAPAAIAKPSAKVAP